MTGALLSMVQQYRHGELGEEVGTIVSTTQKGHTCKLLGVPFDGKWMPFVHFNNLSDVRTRA